jgi:hypothetical protein
MQTTGNLARFDFLLKKQPLEKMKLSALRRAHVDEDEQCHNSRYLGSAD